MPGNGLAIGSGGGFLVAQSSTQLRPDSAQGYISFDLGTTGVYSWNSADLVLARLAAASLRQGGAPSATPVAQTFTLGEASRPGTDANVGGSSGTIRSGLGTGTGTASSLIFQTPTVAGAGSGAQSYTSRLTLAADGATLSVPIITFPGLQVGNPSAADSSGAILVQDNTGINHVLSAASSGVYGGVLAGLTLGSGGFVSWDSATSATTGGPDLSLARLAAASLRQGKAPNATPVAQTFTLGESSRPSTDTNVGGANGTMRTGLGTGTGTAASLIFQTPTTVGSGSSVQTYATRLTLDVNTAAFTVGVTSTALIKSSSATAGIGYATGAGSTVTQLTSKATGVTLNNICGTITMHNATLNAATTVTFTLTDSAIAATDTVILGHASAGTAGAYQVTLSAVAAGSCQISVRNITAGNLGEAIVLVFVVIKAVAS